VAAPGDSVSYEKFQHLGEGGGKLYLLGREEKKKKKGEKKKTRVDHEVSRGTKKNSANSKKALDMRGTAAWECPGNQETFRRREGPRAGFRASPEAVSLCLEKYRSKKTIR